MVGATHRLSAVNRSPVVDVVYNIGLNDNVEEGDEVDLCSSVDRNFDINRGGFPISVEVNPNIGLSVVDGSDSLDIVNVVGGQGQNPAARVGLGGVGMGGRELSALQETAK